MSAALIFLIPLRCTDSAAPRQVLGEVLSGVRSEILIATKCGLVWNDSGQVRHDLSRDALRRDLEASLQRLKTDYIDLYQIHWPDRRTPLEETLDELVSFQRSRCCPPHWRV